ncbi:hypothetical protein [Serratia sp. M24T3]|uniref:hypothetical protein n=1 Tax=Serratia sp. M24T3 TaxID=932213 RepID=UPI0005694B04|nr:hypothetical protein [Serratia sp. M24T3]
MIDRKTLELTMIQMACQSGDPLDRHMLYTIRNGVAQALQAKERHKQRMTTPDYQWKKPVPRR